MSPHYDLTEEKDLRHTIIDTRDNHTLTDDEIREILEKQEQIICKLEQEVKKLKELLIIRQVERENFYEHIRRKDF